MKAQTAQRAATTRMRLRRWFHGQNATNGAVHAKVQMHQMGLKQVTCKKSESGKANFPGKRAGKTDPKKMKTHAAKTTQYTIGTFRCANAKLTRTSAQDSNIARPKNRSSIQRG